MNRVPFIFAAGALIAGGVLLLGQTSLPEPRKQFGASITGAFEGWFPRQSDQNARIFLIGYYNRNTQQELDIPIGPDNRIEPGGPDMGQPTHFLPRRNRFIFSVRVPKDWGEKELVWTLTTRGKTEKAYVQKDTDRISFSVGGNWLCARANDASQREGNERRLYGRKGDDALYLCQ